ncbi:MAG: hypothetical protein JEZ14_19280 [Marinilabiliaceae bacterium]|nr:hypothetical protein [Marinilabiliaceae bacterium]
MKEIAFSLFITNERFLLLQLIVSLLQKKLEALPILNPIYEKLVGMRDQMEEALQKNTGSTFTPLLAQFDEQQDNGFICFRNGVNAKKYSIVNESLRPMAEQIESIIRRHSWSLMKLGYQKQLALSRSLIAELNTPANQLLIQQLNQQDEFEAWSEAVDNFEKSFTQKVEASAAKNDVAASEISKEAISVIEKLLPGWYYQAEFGNDANYRELVDQILEGASDIESQARARITRRRNQKEAEVN